MRRQLEMFRNAATRRYLCVAVDVIGYGRRDDLGQARVQHDLVEVLDRAGARAAAGRRRWVRQASGDGEVALVPAGEPHERVIGDYCLELADALRRHNNTRDRLRLRLAVDEGPVDLARNGFAGRAVVGAGRLVGARPLRVAMDVAERADLAVLFADGVFRDWIHSGRSAVRPEWCRRVAVAEKEYCADAWLWLPA